MSVTECVQRVVVDVGMTVTKVIVDGEVVIQSRDQAHDCDFSRLLDVLHVEHEVLKVMR